MNSIFAKISSRENISNSLFAKFSSRENKVLYSIPRIVIDNNDIERVTQAKVLGVTLSSDLTWNAHVDTIVSRLGSVCLQFTN